MTRILKLETLCNQTTVEFDPESWREVTLIHGNMPQLERAKKKEREDGEDEVIWKPVEERVAI